MLKKLCYFLIFFTVNISAQVDFDHYFTGERLRFDYGETGNYETSAIYPYHFIKEAYWGGPRKNLLDTFRYGEMFVEVYDSVSGTLLYSRGYSTLFNEWQTTREAKRKERVFIESVVVPYPRNTIHMVLSERKRDMSFAERYATYFNPHLSFVRKEKPPADVEYHSLAINGPSSQKVDIVFVSEGYTANEKEKFFTDATRFMNIMLSWEPYIHYRKAFNFRAVYVPSDEDGTDIPTDSIWKNTALNTSFDTFGNDRYLTTDDMVTLRNIISGVPYDQVCIIVNTSKYGGGGIYNDYSIFSSDNKHSGFLFMHEFGHAFASLGDEYYSSSGSQTHIIDPHYEPYQPNITTLVDFAHKWKDMVPDTVPIPTPDSSIYHHVVGVFEGAGYSSKNVYRPYYDCTMKSVINNAFCPVCRRAIVRMIRFYDNGK